MIEVDPGKAWGDLVLSPADSTMHYTGNGHLSFQSPYLSNSTETVDPMSILMGCMYSPLRLTKVFIKRSHNRHAFPAITLSASTAKPSVSNWNDYVWQLRILST